MSTLPRTPLDPWIGRRIGLANGDVLTRDALTRTQLAALRETLAHARSKSPFYRRRLPSEKDVPIQGLVDVAALPLTTPEDLRERGMELLCVSQSDVARIVTLKTPEASPKRVFFTEEDLERTIDFFHVGMSGIAAPGQRILILMPGSTPGSVGDLLVKGLRRMGAEGRVHGPVHDAGEVLSRIVEESIDGLVGIPAQVLALARHPDADRVPPGRIRSVLLSSDYVPEALVQDIKRTWSCKVFEHYGMTEMGLGGGVQCAAREGYHLREADLFFEIVDPETGRPLPEGETGEVVFTTLGRRGMPLIRYRTGDLSRFIPEPCPCGTALKRLDRIRGRLREQVAVGKACTLMISDLDEAVFAVPGVLSYRAEIERHQGKDVLRLAIHPAPGHAGTVGEAVSAAVRAMPLIRGALARGDLELSPVRFTAQDRPSTGVEKRRIVDRRM